MVDLVLDVSPPTEPEVISLLQQEFAWLSASDLQEILSKKGEAEAEADSTHVPSSSGSAAAPVPVPEQLPEDILAAVSAELHGLKEQYSGYDEVGTIYFTVRVLGGEWSITKRNVPCTDVGAYAIERTTKLWCSGVGWPSSKSFAVRKHGGPNFTDAGRRSV